MVTVSKPVRSQKVQIVMNTALRGNLNSAENRNSEDWDEYQLERKEFEKSVFGAHKVLDEMPESFPSLELINKVLFLCLLQGNCLKKTKRAEIDDPLVIGIRYQGRKEECEFPAELVGLLQSSRSKVVVFDPGGAGESLETELATNSDTQWFKHMLWAEMEEDLSV